LWALGFANDVIKGPDIGPKSGGCTLWQHTSEGSVPGIAGNVDLSRFVGPRATFDAPRL